MMKKKKSNPWMLSKALYVIPVAVLALSAFATPKFVAPIEETVTKLEGKSTENSLNLQAFEEEKGKIKVEEISGEASASVDEAIEKATQPLIVLNGKIFEIPKGAKDINSEEQLTKLLNINVEDVESITVLQKDAAIAKWGEKGSNGAIVITTKEAKDANTEAVSIKSDLKVLVDGKEMTPHEAIKAVQGKEIQNSLTTLPDGSTALSVETKAPNDTIYNVVEVNAKYPGGEGEMYKFIASNIRYPQLCKDFAVQGRVIVRFVVEKDGSITNVEKVRGAGKTLSEVEVTAYKEKNPNSQEKLEAGQDLGELLYEEAERVLKLMPKWEPAKDKDGNVVRSLYNLPIMFRLN